MGQDSPQARANADGLTLAQRLHLAQEIARLVRARLPLEEALRSLAKDAPASLAQAIEVVTARLEQGHSLRQSLAPISTPDARMLAASLELGQLSGALDLAIEDWITFYTTQQRFTRRLASALIYPFLLICVAFASILFSAWHLLPRYQQAFIQLAETRPDWLDTLATIHEYYWQLASIAIAGLLAIGWMGSRPWRGVDRQGIPRNRAMRQLYFSQIARLGVLGIRSGQPVVNWLPWLLEGVGQREVPSDSLGVSTAWSHRLGNETCAVLHALMCGQISAKSAESLLHTIAQNAAEQGELAVERDVQWLPMLISICVGLTSVITYVGLIYFPWVALFYQIAIPG